MKAVNSRFILHFLIESRARVVPFLNRRHGYFTRAQALFHPRLGAGPGVPARRSEWLNTARNNARRKQPLIVSTPDPLPSETADR
ncbi:MAG: hypothetical protein HWE37_16240 [Rhodobacteraceae bacterium]|nr:hypothetical protein [Paracoccaceae bacterium]